LLGTPGAIASDLMMQLFGVAAVVLVLPIVVWGCRLIAHRQAGMHWTRLLLWIVGILLAAAFASCLPKTATWPLPTASGGFIGDAILRLPNFFLGPPSKRPFPALAVAFGLAATAALAAAASVGWRKRLQPQDHNDWIDEAANADASMEEEEAE